MSSSNVQQENYDTRDEVDSKDRGGEAGGSHPSGLETQPGAKKEASLRKELTLVGGVAFVVGSIIGSGIFITPSTILRHTGSFGLSLSTWITGGIISLAGGLCYCELGTFVKKSGGEYAYIREAYSFKQKSSWYELLGSLLAFLFVWTSAFVMRPAGIGIILLTFGSYLCQPFYGDQEVPLNTVKSVALLALGEFISPILSTRDYSHRGTCTAR